MWLEVAFESTLETQEADENILWELGAVAVTFFEPPDESIWEPTPGEIPRWQHARVVGLFEAPASQASLADILSARLARPIHCQVLADQDWTQTWMENYTPMQFGNRLWVCPHWITPPVPDAINLRLDPGIAFGTGTHPTTALCLRHLDSLTLSKSMHILDYGCGSGILAIAAGLLGGDNIWAIDHCQQAIDSTRQNADRNAVTLSVGLPADLPEDFQADLLLGNLLAGPLVDLAPTFNQHTAPGATLVLSGLLATQVPDVLAAYQPFANLTAQAQEDDWMVLVLQKRG